MLPWLVFKRNKGDCLYWSSSHELLMLKAANKGMLVSAACQAEADGVGNCGSET